MAGHTSSEQNIAQSSTHTTSSTFPFSVVHHGATPSIVIILTGKFLVQVPCPNVMLTCDKLNSSLHMSKTKPDHTSSPWQTRWTLSLLHIEPQTIDPSLTSSFHPLWTKHSDAWTLWLEANSHPACREHSTLFASYKNRGFRLKAHGPVVSVSVYHLA